ncbi:MAG TPA: hypothetical protein VGL66_03500 [Caulobacteraceae bacterium]|jgi:hypothetical protein
MTLTFRRAGLALAGLLACLALPALAETPRDGAHDFDFARGAWRTHATSIQDPFDGGTHTTVFDGTKTAHAVWGGKAWMEEIEADSPTGGHWEGMTLFTYNTTSHQWSQTYFDGPNGEMQTPSIGSFKDGRGEFYGTDTYKGRSVLARGIWSDITADAHRFEIDLSDDGGRTWHTSFKADLTRLKP